MSIIKCRECKQSVSSKAESCPHCGNPIYKQRQRAKTVGPIVAGVVLSVAGFAVFMLAVAALLQIGQGQSVLGKDAEERRSTAYYTARDFVRKSLKSPASADFPTFRSRDAGAVRVKGSKNSYQAWGYVDAQNAFGAMLRSEWVAYLENVNGDRWRLQYLRLGDEEYGVNPQIAKAAAKAAQRIADAEAAEKQTEEDERQRQKQLEEQQREALASRYKQIKEQYFKAFKQPKEGTRVALKTLSGTEMSGKINTIAQETVSLRLQGDAQVSLDRAQLAPRSRGKIWAEDFAEWFARRETGYREDAAP